MRRVTLSDKSSRNSAAGTFQVATLVSKMPSILYLIKSPCRATCTKIQCAEQFMRIATRHVAIACKKHTTFMNASPRMSIHVPLNAPIRTIRQRHQPRRPRGILARANPHSPHRSHPVYQPTRCRPLLSHPTNQQSHRPPPLYLVPLPVSQQHQRLHRLYLRSQLSLWLRRLHLMKQHPHWFHPLSLMCHQTSHLFRLLHLLHQMCHQYNRLTL